MALAKLSELLSSVKDNSYAIGSFNVSNMEMGMGAIKAAEKMQAPIIIQIAEGRLRYSPLEILGPIMMAAAKNTTESVGDPPIPANAANGFVGMISNNC